MAEVVASSLVRLVCDKMGTKLIKEYGLLSGANKDLKKLEGTLKTIQDVLDDAEGKQEKGRALKGWLKKLKDAAFEIDDLLDDAALEARKSKNKNIPGLKGKVCKLSSIPHSIKFRSKFSHKAKKIMEKLDEIAAERSKFHLQEKITTEGNGEDSMVRESSSFVIESEVYGREEDKEKVIEFLISTGNANDIGVMAIVGMGGLGKTTIAQLVYNDERVQKHFENLRWVSVNDNFDIRRITNSILGLVTESNSDSNLELMQHKLKKQLGGQRFLLVLDDVWNENSEKWDRLRALLTIGAKGSKVIVTTRSTRVASIMGTVSPYILTGLSKEDCWLLFERRAFTLGTNEASSNFVTIGKQIVKKCGGVPLAAKVLGSLMRFKRKEREWLAIRDNDILNITDVDDEILPSLRLSYICLPPHLKLCFTYCALFPKNETIDTRVLIQLWIAEGFIQPRGTREELEDVGMEYVEELLSRSLFQVGELHDDGPTVCRIKMHDLIHDLANYEAGEECSIVDPNGITNITENTRYSSFICENGLVCDTFKSSELISSNLRTLYLVPSGINRGEEHEQQKDFLNYVCSKFILLRALYLHYYPIKELPISLRKLAHLRYLDLSHTNLEALTSDIGHLQNLTTLDLGSCFYLENLPDSIGELCNLIILNLCSCYKLRSLPDSIGQLRSLQDLDLTCCQMIETLPESIANLINLKSLRLKCCYFLHELPSKIREMRSLIHLDLDTSLECLPCGIGDLCHLRTLPIFVPGGKTKCSMTELGKLDLKGKLEIKNLENVQTQQEAKEAKLILKNDLRDLKLSWNLHACTNNERKSIDTEELEKSMYEYFEIIAKLEYNIDIAQVEHILENLHPPNMLSNLEIEGYLGKILPKWLMNSQLPNLVHLKLDSCFKCETLPEFKKLRSLKTLELNGLMEVRSLNSIGQAPSLEVLKLCCLPLIKCLDCEFYSGDAAFTRLVELELCCMPELEEWSDMAARHEFLPRLYKLSIILCPKLKKLPSTFCTVEELEMFVDDQLLLGFLASLGSGGFPNLEDLHLSGKKKDVPVPEVIEEHFQTVIRTNNMIILRRKDEFTERIEEGFKALGCMSIFVPGGKTKCSMTELGQLDLKEKLEIKGLENVQTQQEAKEAKLILKNDLRDLKLSWNLHACTNNERKSIDTEELEKSMYEYFEIIVKLEYNIDIAQVEHILENLHPPNMLSNLEIEEFQKLRSLKTLKLIGLTAVRSLNSIGQAPSLKVLQLSYLPLIKCLHFEFYGGDAAFPQLVELELGGMPELEEWSDVATGHEILPRLYKLSILLWPKLKKLPSTFCTVGKLEMSVNDQLLLDSLGSGGFLNLKEMHLSLNKEMHLSLNKEDVPFLPDVIDERWEVYAWSNHTISLKLKEEDLPLPEGIEEDFEDFGWLNHEISLPLKRTNC
ncbi:putative disease resistance protein RGA1 [Carex littledalei]|uniref:Putative disease resistance protein RGA1 n=1 Tax=Carex littledalei TaxID=544730 RepID=A0A833W2I2_9POAL|nr:putative disease resistance protein RGA1 [Carex littledalei]